MPKEQPFLAEHGSCATSSKNAKNKSNRMTLLAMRDTKDADGSSGRASRCSSEKDSGYSDGQQTDVEDQRSYKSECRGGERSETSQSGQHKDLRRGDSGKPTLMPADRELPPIYIINNIVINQPDMIQKRDQPPQRNGSRENCSSGAAHMILFQQPSTLPATRQLHNPTMSRSSNVTGKNINGTYLPILNSYPRIAPHPSKKPPDKSPSNDESQNLSKRVCTQREGENAPVARSPPEQHLYEQPKLASSTARCSSPTTDRPSSSSPATVPVSQSSPCGPALHTTSSALKPRGLHRNGSTRTRQHRFLNTMEVLRQSGLLDITLRTRELLRQSNATERDIAQLRQHTELLCQAVSNSSCTRGDTAAWERLHRAMAESGSYPAIKSLQNVQTPCNPDSAGQPASVANGPRGGESSEAPSSRCGVTIPDLNSGRELEAGGKSLEKDAFVPPDSSTD